MESLSIRLLDSSRIHLVVEGFPVAYVNAIRRVILSDVPTMAVDFGYVYDNSTPVYDEMILHRMGLVVLRSDEALAKYRSPEECRGKEPEHTERCYVDVILQVEAPRDGAGRYVRASELVIGDPDVEPVNPETPITYIGPGQRLHVVAYARLGRGREHGKWSPASAAVLRYTPIVHYNSELASGECLECLSAYPQVVEALKGGGKGSMEVDAPNTSGLRYCSEAACRGAVEVEYDKSRLHLEVESTGALRPERIVLEATRELERRINDVKRALEKARIAG